MIETEKNIRKNLLIDINIKLAETLVRKIHYIKLLWTKTMNKLWLKLSIIQQKVALLSLCTITSCFSILMIIGIIKIPITYKKTEILKSNNQHFKTDSIFLLEKIYQSQKNP